MTRPSRAESQARTRARLVASAAECFAERGFHGTTVEAVVRRCDLSRGAFYSNFDSLDDLFLAVFDDRMVTEAMEVTDLLAEVRCSEDLTRLLRVRRTEHPIDVTWQLLLAEFRLHALRDPRLRPKLAEREKRLRDSYELSVEHLARLAGIRTPIDGELIALVVQVLEDGIIYHDLVERDGIRPEAFIESVALLFDAVVALAGKAPERLARRRDSATSSSARA